MLARRGHQVTLVRPPSPPASALAESIAPSARKLLAELGIEDVIDRAGFHPNRGNTVAWAGQPPRSETFGDGAEGHHVERGALEGALTRAAEDSGVRVRTGLVRSATESGDGWAFHCAGDDGTTVLRAPWALDATGRHGLIARREGREPDRSTTTIALVGRWRSPGGFASGIEGHTLLESYPDGWAWSVPLDDETRCVTAMVDHRYVELESDALEADLRAELAKTTMLRRFLDGADGVGPTWACPASLYRARRYGRDGMLIVGDAGSFIDPLSSYGVKKALSSGWLAGVVAHTALIDVPMAGVAADFFDRRERDVYARYRLASAPFFQEAADAYRHDYWMTRADAAWQEGGRAHRATAPASGTPEPSDPDDALLPTAPPESATRAAFDVIRGRERLGAQAAPELRTFDRAAIRGHRLVLEQHLASVEHPGGIRWVRGVDLVRLVEVAPLHDDVPEGWSAYNGVASPVTLPDYLTALATAFAAGLLVHTD